MSSSNSSSIEQADPSATAPAPYAPFFAKGRWFYGGRMLKHRDQIYWQYRPVGFCRECDGHLTSEEAKEHMREWLAHRAALVMASGKWCCEAPHRLKGLQRWVIERGGWLGDWMPAAAAVGWALSGTSVWLPVCRKHQREDVRMMLLPADPAEVLR